MKLSARFFSSLYLSLLFTSISGSVLAAQTEEPERWFEIEVILFKQLGDKTLLQEQFPDNISSTSLPQYKNNFDLLTSYIQPDLIGVKQFMPLCSEKDSQIVLLESLQQTTMNFSNAIKAIEQVDSFNFPKFTTMNKVAVPQKERVLKLQEELANPLFSTKNLCIISRTDIEALLTDEQLTNFKLDAFDVELLPTKLNASGAHLSNTPYLIADESLLLSDIKQRLQWSKEFKPLLHLGWRQIAVTRDKAIPFKLFAGEHLESQYQQALHKYQSALNEAKLAEQLAFQQVGNVEQQEVDDVTAQKEQNNDADIKQQKLTQIFNELETVDDNNINELVSALERQTFEKLINVNEITTDESEKLSIGNAPIEPLQPWFLDGFFKVHLDHYLYITADFNVLSKSLNKSNDGTANNSNVKLVNFSQNKRAITGEIHYFDHPYIGMIVQIRRFDPTKPKEEAVTQVIKR